MRVPTTVILVLAVLGGLAAAPAPPPGDTCREAGGPERGCRTAEVVADGTAALCRGTLQEESTCQQVDGKPIDPALVDAHLESWTHRALDLQFHLGDDVPFAEAVFPATHNSFNAAAYAPPSVAGADPNQRYPIYEQLRLDMRGLELDVVAAPDPTTGEQVPLLCHSVCSANDRPLAEGVAEIARWLAENPGEVVLIDIQNGLGGDAAVHDRAAAALRDGLGDAIYKRPQDAGACVPLPLDMTRAEVLAAGAQVVLFTSCGAGGDWPALVHSTAVRSQSRIEGFEGFPACREQAAERYETRFTRHWEDSTWLSSLPGSRRATVADVRAMTDCALNMPSLDMVVPGDPRLDAFVWSWAPDEPGVGLMSGCAAQGADGRFRVRDCDEELPVACRQPGGAWLVRAETVTFDRAQAMCGVDSFDVPRTGWENQQLRRARPPGAGDVWLGHHLVDGEWVPTAAR